MIGPPSNIDAIIPDPEFVLLKSAVTKLRIELSMLVLERDELVLHECKNIEAAYMLALGALEYKVFEAECALARLKRKTTLIQARVNRREKIAIPEIEAQLDTEFAEYKAKLEAMIEDMNKALMRSKNKLLTADESRELKKLYHAIVKALHPDLNPGLGGAKRRLFENAVAAYENGDLETMQTIAEMISEPGDFSAVNKSFEKEGSAVLESEIKWIPNTTVTPENDGITDKMERLLDLLEDNDDVQNVWHNCEGL